MTHPPGDPAIPDPAERARRNAALHSDNIETGFFDDHGRPAPWPDDTRPLATRNRRARHRRARRTTLLTSTTRKISRYTTSGDLTPRDRGFCAEWGPAG